MSHTSPSSYLVWALLSCMLGIFLVYHLYSFDRFKCLKWNVGPYSGAFKRIMTYSYLFSVPLIMIYSVGFAIIKYREGYIYLALEGVIPTPYQLWAQNSRDCIFPLTLCFALAWSLEMVTHLEELCFWLFVINTNANQHDWFQSRYFKSWIVGSVGAVIYMPIFSIFTRGNPLKSEAYTFLAGSIGSLGLTVAFMPVLWSFPSMLSALKSQGAESATLARLTKFHELNTIRVAFRYLFTVPLLILGIDGVRPHHHINNSNFWTDILTFIAAIGCTVSSGITLVIFFPRSLEKELAAQDAAKSRKQSQQIATAFSATALSTTMSMGDDAHAFKAQGSLVNQEDARHPHRGNIVPMTVASKHSNGIPHSTPQEQSEVPIRPNRKHGSVVELGGIGAAPTRYNLSTFMQPSRRCSDDNDDIELGELVSPAPLRSSFPPPSVSSDGCKYVNPIVHVYTSPIDLRAS